MAQTPGVSSLTVSEMVWPGTHDTGANNDANLNFDIPADSLTSSAQWRAFAGSKFTMPSIPGITPAAIEELLRNITITHPGQSVYNQMMNGARFLDLRVARSAVSTDTNFYLVHTFVVGNLSDALSEILRFADNHRGEVLIVKIQPKFNINSYNETMELINFVESFQSPSGVKIRDFAFTKQLSQGTNYSQCGTIGNLVSSNKRLLLTYDTSSTPSGPLAIDTWFFWREAFFTDRWTGTDKVANKHAILLADIRRMYTSPNNGRIYQVGFTLTPPSAPPGQLPIGAPSLSELSSRMNPTLELFVFTMMNESVRSFTNVYTTDFSVDYRYEINAVMRRLIAERVARKQVSTLPPATVKTSSTTLAMTTSSATRAYFSRFTQYLLSLSLVLILVQSIIA